MSLNELEVIGIKQVIKEILDEEVSMKLDELQDDVKELQEKNGLIDTNEYETDEPEQTEEEPEYELPEEQPLKQKRIINPKRQQYEESLKDAKQLPTGTRLNKEDFEKIGNPPNKTKIVTPKGEVQEDIWNEEDEI